MALQGSPLDVRPPSAESQYDPRMVDLMKQMHIWHPGLVYPSGSRLAMHEADVLASIHNHLAQQDALAESRAQRADISQANRETRQDIATQRLDQARQFQQSLEEDRTARREATQFSRDTQRAQALQMAMADPNLTAADKANAKTEYMKLMGIPTTAAAPGTKGEYGPGGPTHVTTPAEVVAGARGATQPGPATPPPVYYGQTDLTGRPVSAAAAPSTVAAPPETGIPLAPNAFARSLGFTDTAGLEQGMASAMMANVLRQPLVGGQATAMQDIGGAGAQQAVQDLYKAEPGATVNYPDIYAAGGGGITNASTYLPQPGEVFRPSIKTSKGGPERIGEVLGGPGYDPNIDPRYAADVLSATNPAVAKQYADIAAKTNFRDVAGTATERPHTFATPYTGPGANIATGENMLPQPVGYTPPPAAFTTGGSAAQPAAAPAPTANVPTPFTPEQGWAHQMVGGLANLLFSKQPPWVPPPPKPVVTNP